MLYGLDFLPLEKCRGKRIIMVSYPCSNLPLNRTFSPFHIFYLPVRCHILFRFLYIYIYNIREIPPVVVDEILNTKNTATSSRLALVRKKF
jgi:hypothetical protein